MTRLDSHQKHGIGVFLRAARRSMGLRQGDLAALTGLPTSHLSDIERGAITPTLSTLSKIAEALNRPLEYFLQDPGLRPRSLGMVHQEFSTGGKAVRKFAELVETKTGGVYKLRLYQLSPYDTAREQVEALHEGAIHMFVDEPLSLERYAELCGIVFQPFFFRDREHYHRFLRSKFFEEQIYQKLSANGILLLNPDSNWNCGSFEILFSTSPVFTPADLAGRKFRSYPSKVSTDLRAALGAIPVVVEWMNVYQAFEQGQIDSFMAPAAFFLATQVQKLARYATLIDTSYTLNLTVAIAEREYSKLAPDIQQILVEAAYQAGEYCTQLAQKQTMVDLRMLNEEYNIPVIHPDEGEWRSRFSWALREVCYGKRLAPELYDAIQEL